MASVRECLEGGERVRPTSAANGFLAVALCFVFSCASTPAVKREPMHVERSAFRGLEIAIRSPASRKVRVGARTKLRIAVTNISTAAFPVLLLECSSPLEPWNAQRWIKPVGGRLTYNAQKDRYEPRRATTEQPGYFAAGLLGARKRIAFELEPTLTDDVGLLQYNLKCIRRNVRLLAKSVYVERPDGTFVHPDAKELAVPGRLSGRIIVRELAGAVDYPIRPTLNVEPGPPKPSAAKLGFKPGAALYSNTLGAWLFETPDGKTARAGAFGTTRYESLDLRTARFIETTRGPKVLVKWRPGGRLEQLPKSRLYDILREKNLRAAPRGARAGRWLLEIEKGAPAR